MTDPNPSLHESVAQAFVHAVRRVAQARPLIEQDGTRRKVSQEKLAQDAGLARSAIAKLLGEGKDANPTLRTICSIADGLGVPPALLLMRDRDWKVLVSAIVDHADFATIPAFRDFAEELSKSTDHSPSRSIENGRSLARLTKYLQTLPPGTDDLTRANVDAQAYRIGATCATPPLQHLHAQWPESVPLILTLCAALGASFRD